MHNVVVRQNRVVLAMHGLSVTLVDYALIFAKNMEKSVHNFRWMILLLYIYIVLIQRPEHNSSLGHQS